MVTLEEVTLIAAPIERCFDLARSIEVHVLDNVHWGESAAAIGGVTAGLPKLGERITWRARHFAIPQRLTSEMTAVNWPTYFQDAMISGIFRSMQHDHYFRSDDEIGTEMRDVFRFAAPVPILGRLAEMLVLRQYMAMLLSERCQVIKRVAESDEWKAYLH